MKDNNKTALTVVMLVLGMFAFAFAAFPLYNIFCKVTGYGGTPQVSDTVPKEIGDKIITVRFNADTAKNLPWEFKTLQSSVDVRTGESKLIFYTAKNIADEDITGIATFNVTPTSAGQYFNKIQCFCFNNQKLSPDEKVNMPVSFYIDPRIEQDPDLKDIDTITLSYSFFEAKDTN